MPTDRLPDTADRVAAESTRTVSRFWWAEAQKIAEQVDDPAARWEILLAALRRVGWPHADRLSKGA